MLLISVTLKAKPSDWNEMKKTAFGEEKSTMKALGSEKAVGELKVNCWHKQKEVFEDAI